MADQEQQAQGDAQVESTEARPSLLDQVIQATPKAEPDVMKGLLDEYITTALQGTLKWDKNVTRSVEAAIKTLDGTVSEQLAAIMHHPKFQKLEGSWRGFHHLVFESETGTQLKIKVLNAPKKDLQKDLERAVEFDQSQLFKKLYENEFGMPGGEPYGALIGDYEFENHPDDIDMLEKISGVAAAAFCPFISAASPNLFGFDDFTELTTPRDLGDVFDTVEFTKWNSFRDSEDARFVTLTMPRVLARLPYGASTKPIDEFGFEEAPLGPDGKPKTVDHSDYCWMNSSYVMGTRLTQAFAKFGFCTAIRGAENGGLVDGLPAHVFRSDDGDLDMKCPTEVGIGDRRGAELDSLGFLPLCHYKDQDYAVFFGGQTTQKPKKYGPKNPDATANAAISARLPYMMATSRIAHFLKVIARDKIGSGMERDDVQDFLNRWITNYVLADEKPSQEMKAKYPLAEAKIVVEEVPGAPGSYQAQAFLRPWLQLEELTTALSMVAKIPQLGG